MTSSKLIRSIRGGALLAASAAVVAGCGGASKAEDDKTPDPTRLSRAFTAATGVELEQRTSSAWTTLDAVRGAGYKRYGGFTIYLVEDDDAKKGLLDSTISSRTVKDYGDGVVVSSSGLGSGDEPAARARLDRAVKAALEGDPSLVAAEDRPCEAAGIDPAQGEEGTCQLADKQLTVVDSGTELETEPIKAKVIAATVARQLPARSEYSEPEQAKGRFLVVRYQVTNGTTQPISSIRPDLIVGENTYTESSKAFSLRDYENDPLPLQPGDTGTLTTAFDVSPTVATEAKERGQLQLPAGSPEGSSYLSDSDAVGRIRLGGTKTLALGNAITEKRELRKAAAERALKQFYTAMRTGNVSYVCKRITRTAQRAAGCGQGNRFVKAAAKKAAPTTSAGLDFTTILTQGQSRAFITVRRQGGGFTDAAGLVKQGGLWRVQYTRRLSSAVR